MSYYLQNQMKTCCTSCNHLFAAKLSHFTRFLVYRVEHAIRPEATQLIYSFSAKIAYLAVMYAIYLFGFAMFTSKWEWILFQSPAVDCGDPGTPTNGQRTLSSTTYNSVVTYTCDVGYTLQGSNSRTCQSDGQWSGSVPPCNRKFIFEYNLTFTNQTRNFL